MRILKKMMSTAFLMCIVGLFLLCSCKNVSENPKVTDENTMNTDNTNVSENETEPSGPGEDKMIISVVDDGKTEFCIVTPDNKSSIVTRTALGLYNHFSNNGVKVDMATDWEKLEPHEYEILVGSTTHEPEGAVTIDRKTLGHSGFIIKATEKRIIISGGTDIGTQEAVAYFIENFCKTDSDGKLRSVNIPKDYCYIESNGNFLSSLTLGGESIDKYSVTAPDEFSESADDLIKFLEKKCGVKLEKSVSGERQIILTSDGSADDVVSANFEGNNLVLRAKDALSMKKAVCCFAFEVVSPAVGSLEIPADMAYSRKLSETVFYSDFGAPSNDGKDCLDAIIAAHNAANAKGYTVFASIDAEYYINSTGKSAAIMTDVLWGDARFVLDDSEIPPEKRGDNIFNIISNNSPIALSGLSALKKGQENIGIKLPSKCLVCLVDANTLRYIRSGGNQNNGSAQTDYIIVDKDGNVDMNAPLIWDFDNYTLAVATPIDENVLTVSGGVFTTVANNAKSEYTYYARGIGVSRSNVTVNNLTHYITGEGKSGAPYNAFLAAYGAYITVKNSTFTGHKTYYTTGSGGTRVGMGTYDILGGGAISLTFSNCGQTNDIINNTYWGIFGSNYCKNITYDGCVFSRFDAHMGVANATVKNSVIGHQGINAIGCGTFLIENTTNYGENFVNLRSDYGSTWQGDFIIKNCSFYPSKTSGYIIGGSNKGDHDYGYTCYMPTTVTIDGFTVGNKVQVYIFANINKNWLSDSYRPQYPYIVTEKVSVKGFFAGEKALLTSPNEYMFSSTVVSVE